MTKMARIIDRVCRLDIDISRVRARRSTIPDDPSRVRTRRPITLFITIYRKNHGIGTAIVTDSVISAPPADERLGGDSWRCRARPGASRSNGMLLNTANTDRERMKSIRGGLFWYSQKPRRSAGRGQGGYRHLGVVT